MPDDAEPRAQTPFATEPVAAPVDALAGDWTEGLRASPRALPFRPPRLIGSGPAADEPVLATSDGASDMQRTEQADLRALAAMRDQLMRSSPPEPEVEAPEAWASAEEDQLASNPPPRLHPESGEATTELSLPREAVAKLVEGAGTVALAAQPDAPGPASAPPVVQEVAPSSVPPPVEAPSPVEVPLPSIIVGNELVQSPGSTDPSALPVMVLDAAQEIVEPEVAPPPPPVIAADTATTPPVPDAPPPTATAPEDDDEDSTSTVISFHAVDLGESVPPPAPAAAPAEEVFLATEESLVAEPLPDDAIVGLPEDLASPAPTPALSTPWDSAAEPWGSAAAAAPVVPAAAGWGDPAPAPTDAWGAPVPAAPPPASDDIWGAPAPAVAATSAWEAAPAPAPTQIPAAAPAAAEWEPAPATVTAGEEIWTPISLESAPPPAASMPPEPTGDSPFAPLAPGASLSEPEPEAPRDTDPDAKPLPLADTNPDAQPVTLSDTSQDLPLIAPEEPAVAPEDLDLLVPVVEPEAPLPAGPLAVLGEHRVAIHTRAGRVRRGIVRDVDLAATQFRLHPQSGGGWETVKSEEVKAIFFMLPPGEKLQGGAGRKVKVTFTDGRSIEGHRDGAEAPTGFFFVPQDAAKANTRRIFVARQGLSEIVES